MKFPLKALEFPILPLLGALARSCRGAGGVQGSGCARLWVCKGERTALWHRSSPLPAPGLGPTAQPCFWGTGTLLGPGAPQGHSHDPGGRRPLSPAPRGEEGTRRPPWDTEHPPLASGFLGQPSRLCFGAKSPGPRLSPSSAGGCVIAAEAAPRAGNQVSPLPALPPSRSPQIPPFSPSASL